MHDRERQAGDHPLGLYEGYADADGNFMDGIGAKLGPVKANVYGFPLGPYLGHVSDDGSVRGLLLPEGHVTAEGTPSATGCGLSARCRRTILTHRADRESGRRAALVAR